MKKLIWMSILFCSVLACGIEEDVKQASAECTNMMAAAINKISSLQDDTCLSKEEVTNILRTLLEESKPTESCDINEYMSDNNE